MNYLSLKLLIVALLLNVCCVTKASAQELKESYDRSALTVLFTNFDNSYADYYNEFVKDPSRIVPAKFYNNQIVNAHWKLPSNGKAFRSAGMEKYLKDQLGVANLGKDVVGYWYGYQEGKGFNLKKLYERAEYNASDEEFYVSNASKRGLARIQDLGEKLVQNSYVLVIDMKEIEKVAKNGDESFGWRAAMSMYLYKLDFGAEKSAELYEAWPFEEDAESVKTAKLNKFQEMKVSFVSSYKNEDMHVSGMDTPSKLLGEKSYDQLFQDMLTSSINEATNKLSKEMEQFQVLTKVVSRHPIKAKIGVKEGLKVDHRYFVYEYVWNEKAGKATPDRKAVVRAKKVVNNSMKRNGQTPSSSFYQIYGGTVKEGMVMKEKRDLGISILGGYEVGGLTGVEIKAMGRFGQFLDVPSLYLILNLGFSNQEYLANNWDEVDDYTFIRYSAGLGKGFRMARIVEIMPYAAYGREEVTLEEDDVEFDMSAMMLKGGVYAGINVTHSVAIYGQINYTLMGDAELKDDDDEEETSYTSTETPWDEFFVDEDGENGRNGGLGIEFGIRIDL